MVGWKQHTHLVPSYMNTSMFLKPCRGHEGDKAARTKRAFLCSCDASRNRRRLRLGRRPSCWPSAPCPASLWFSSSVVSHSLRPHRLQHIRFRCPSPSLEFAQTPDAILSSHLLSSLFPPALNLSQHQDLFQWIDLHIRWPMCRIFSFSISPSNEYSGLISSRID